MKQKHIKWFIFPVIAALFTAAADRYFEVSKNLEIFSDVYKHLNAFYVDEVDPEELVATGIDAMLESLDPYNDYIPSDELDQFQFEQTGEYGGIGATIQQRDDYVIIVEPYKGSPADKQGLQSGDKIISIDGESAKGLSSSDAVKKLKGKPGTAVAVTLKRGDEEFSRDIEREKIRVDNVPYYGIFQHDFGYIKLNGFKEGAGKEVTQAMENMRAKAQIKGIILDMQGNGGGLLSEAINVLNVFVDKGTTVVTTKGRNGQIGKEYTTKHNALDATTPLVVLINYGSASAAEIVAGTIQDLDRGIVIGQHSYGKGLVQSTRPVAYNSYLKITTSKYYIPSGRSIQRLNYADKNEDGKPAEVPDSLKKAFTTRNGRTVYDGEGIEPDIEVDDANLSAISGVLFANNYIFDYSVNYFQKHPTLTSPPTEFELSDADYTDFLEFISDKDYTYKTQTEKELAELKKALSEDKYSAILENAVAELEKKVQQTKSNDLQLNKKDITYLLELEITNRYYYRYGRYASALDENKELQKAAEILQDLVAYKKLLGTES